MPGRGRVAAVVVDLPDSVGDRLEQMRVGDHPQHTRRPATDPLVIAVGNRHVDVRVAVGGRTEQEAFLTETDPPRVVVRAAEEFQTRNGRTRVRRAPGAAHRCGADDVKPIESLAKRMLLADYGTGEPGIPHDAPVPIIQPVVQVARPGVRIADTPPAEQLTADVGHVVAVGILQEERGRGLRDNQAAVGERQTRWDAQFLGEHGELVRPPVAVRILADTNPVAAVAWGLHVVGVIDRLGDPEPSPLVPSHTDRLADLGLGREQLDAKSDRRHRMPH